jgi:predicted Rossmann fold nucleotide-binding protein DprA/Smf involved in DNA uptake
VIIVIKKIISGGQTGADRAALDAAIELGIPHGGFIISGRKTEDGRLPQGYDLKEIDSNDYAERTELNVAGSDGTVIISHGGLKGGSAQTLIMAEKHNKPCFHIDLENLGEDDAADIIKDWIQEIGIKILNVAGPRASEDPGIYESVRNVLRSALA